MPVYEFVCETCRLNGELEQSITEPLPDTCPDCGENDPEKWHQVYDGNIFIFCKGEPTTVGQQAEINARRVGKEQMAKMIEESKVANHKGKRAFKMPRGGTPTTERYEAKRPWWRPDSDQPLDVSKIKDKKKFVLEGKTT